jgi:hypothetical protein
MSHFTVVSAAAIATTRVGTPTSTLQGNQYDLMTLKVAAQFAETREQLVSNLRRPDGDKQAENPQSFHGLPM